ncbi:MAG: mobile mystery protein B [Bacteroidia bacterium]
MGLEIEYIDGQTPLDEDEKDGLLIQSITTRGELDEFEQQNIEEAVAWSLNNRFKRERIVTEDFVRELHTRMLGGVWRWAGEFRKTNKNIGVDWHQIGVSLKQLNGDCLYWIDNKTYPEEEIAMRFKHGIVNIHCFPNGNGRHSRLIADIIVSHVFGKTVFTWSGGNLNKPGDARANYLRAIREADKGNVQPLLTFART